MIPVFVLALAVLVLSLAITRWMIQVNIAALPNERSNHERPTPSSGGVAIVASLLFGLAIIGLNTDAGFAKLTGSLFASTVFILVACGIAVMALIDDMTVMKARVKLGLQLVFALIFTVFVGYVRVLPLPVLGDVELGLFGYLGTIVWLIFFTNAFNFMDGINGIAGGTALIAAIALAAIAYMAGHTDYAVFCIVLAAATTGFLVYNFPGGRIFMGDVGSQFIGFVFAGLAILGVNLPMGDSTAAISLYVVPILFFPFLFDVVVTLGYRALRKQNIMRAHKEHLYQIGIKLGRSHVEVSVIYFALAVAAACVAYLAQQTAPGTSFLYLLALIVPGGILAALTYRMAWKAKVIDAI